MRLAFAREARDDFVRLRAFIAEHDPGAVQRVAQRLLEGIGRLVRHPRLGRRVTLAAGEPGPEELRDWHVGDYVVRYLIAGERVLVLRLWHHRERRP